MLGDLGNSIQLSLQADSAVEGNILSRKELASGLSFGIALFAPQFSFLLLRLFFHSILIILDNILSERILFQRSVCAFGTFSVLSHVFG